MDLGLALFTWRNILPPFPYPATPGDACTCSLSTGSQPETICFSLKTAVLGVLESCRPEPVFPVVSQSHCKTRGTEHRASSCSWRGWGWNPSHSNTPGFTHNHTASVSPLGREGAACQRFSTLRVPHSPRCVFRLTR